MADAPQLPARLAGGPIPADPSVTEWVPMGLHRGLPPVLGAALRGLLGARRRLGHARQILAHGVDPSSGLGIRGLHHDAAPGWLPTAEHLRELPRHVLGQVHPSRLSDLRGLAAMEPGEARAAGRLGRTYALAGRGYEPVEHAEAVADAARALAEVEPGRQGWIVAGEVATNEAAYAIARGARLLGGPHVDHDSRLHDGALTAALGEVLDTPASTAGLADLARADLVLLWGVQAADAPGLLDLLADARTAGTRVVAIDAAADPGFRPSWLPSRPLASLFGARLVDDHVLLAPGDEPALVEALIAQLAAWGVGPAPSAEAPAPPIAAVPFEWLAQLLVRAGTVVSVMGPGLAQQPRGTPSARAVLQLHHRLGAHGRPGCGVLALRPHAGSQGCDDLGLASGHDVLSQLQAAADGQLDLLVLVGPALAGDLPRATVRAALAKVPRRIHLISHLDDTVGIPPAADGQVWLLPLCDLFEHPEAHTLTSLDRRVQRTPELPTRGVLGDARPAWQWVAELVGRARPDAAEALAWPTADALRLQIAEEHPAYEGLGSLGPERPALQWGGPRLVPAAPPALPASGPRPVPEGYTVVARRGAAAPDTIGLSARDASREGVTDGDRVVLASSVGRVEGRVEVLPIAEGHLWVAWPALGALLPGEREAEGGSLITTTTVTLTAP